MVMVHQETVQQRTSKHKHNAQHASSSTTHVIRLCTAARYGNLGTAARHSCYMAALHGCLAWQLCTAAQHGWSVRLVVMAGRRGCSARHVAARRCRCRVGLPRLWLPVGVTVICHRCHRCHCCLMSDVSDVTLKSDVNDVTLMSADV